VGKDTSESSGELLSLSSLSIRRTSLLECLNRRSHAFLPLVMMLNAWLAALIRAVVPDRPKHCNPTITQILSHAIYSKARYFLGNLDKPVSLAFAPLVPKSNFASMSGVCPCHPPRPVPFLQPFESLLTRHVPVLIGNHGLSLRDYTCF
jgi:hypothetical protein